MESTGSKASGSKASGFKPSGKKRKLPPKYPSQGIFLKLIAMQQLVIFKYFLDAATESGANVEKPFTSTLTGLLVINQVDARPPSPKRQNKFTQLNMYRTKKTTFIPNINDDKFVCFFHPKNQKLETCKFYIQF